MKEVIKMKEPKGLRNHISAVVKMESNMFCQMLAGQSQPEHHYTRGNSSGTKSTQSGGSQNTDKTKTSEAGKSAVATTVRPRLHLSPQEWAELKRLKLCFKCREKWFKGYICGNPELQVFTVVNGFEVEILGECEQDEESVQCIT